MTFKKIFLSSIILILSGGTFFIPSSYLKETSASSYYLTGTMTTPTAWRTDDSNFNLSLMSTGIYRWFGTLNKDTEFKLFNSSIYYGDNYLRDVVSAGQKQGFIFSTGGISSADDNIKVALTGNYMVEWNSTNSTLYVILVPKVLDSTNKIRVWFAPGSNWRTAGAKFRLDVNGQEIPQLGYWYNSGTFDNSDWQMFVYFDVNKTDLRGNAITFKRLNPANDAVWDTSAPTDTYNDGDNAKYYDYPDGEWGGGKPILATIPNEAFKVDNGLVSFVLSGFFSCEMDINNGYLNKNNISLNWIQYEAGNFKVSGLLSEYFIKDFSGVGSSQYSNVTNLNSYVSTLQKYNELLS